MGVLVTSIIRDNGYVCLPKTVPSTRNEQARVSSIENFKLRNFQAYCGNVKESVDTGERGDKAHTGEGAKLDRD